MTPDPTLQASYATFLTEAQDILKRIEQDLLSLREARSIERVHRLMRSAHTLKGAAASVEMETIKQVAHVLEDLFKALYNPDVVIDAEVESLLFEGYECLRLPVMAAVTGGQIDAQSILNRAAAIIAKLQDKLGDCFNREAPLPTSVELGFDVVQSMFQVTVGQRLQELEQIIRDGSLEEVQSELWAKADVFLGFAESLDLPGFGAIAQATLAALEAHPEQGVTIAQLALEDFSQGRTAVLAGDRTQGGAPSLALQALAAVTPADGFAEAVNSTAIEAETNPSIDVSVTELFEISAESLSLDELFGEVKAESESLPSDNEPSNNLTSTAKLPIADAEFQAVSTSVEPLTVEPLETPKGGPVRVDVEQLKHLDYLAGELLINQSKQTNQDQQFRTVVQELRSGLRQHQQTMYHLQDAIERLLDQVERGKTWLPAVPLNGSLDSEWTAFTAPAFTATFDALEMERYNDLRLLIRSALNETVQLDDRSETIDQLTKQSRRTLEVQRRLMSQVRDDLTALRMHPLRDLLNRFPRLLQQLVTAHGKPAELIMSGTTVLVDKVVAEKLYDPLLHLIRNAFDHGIEPPELRRAQGKSDVGRIEIQANQQGNQTVIEVKDDGRGIDLQRVAQRAIELKLITAEQARTMPESELLDLLFQPGFSTATEISDLSGRGIGLDVVNSQLQSVNGSIAVSTAPQQGTTFTLKIPLSLTTTRLLVCQAQGFAYALPVERVEQIVVPLPEQLNLLGGEQLVMHWHHNQEELVVPLYSLSELVQYADISTQLRDSTLSPSTSLWKTTSDQTAPVLLLQTIYGYRGLRVDRVLGEQELVIRTLGTAIAPPPYVYGCCILGDSRSALAIDVEVLMQLTTEVESSPEHALPIGATLSPLTRSLTASSIAVPQLTGQAFTSQTNLLQLPHTRTILVVDDSLTLRHNLTLLLKSAGYHVLQAGDGLEALIQLQQQSSIELVVCDVEMPRLNGFEFLNQSRQDPAFAQIPVVILTSRSSSKHRQIALTLGAAAYFTKPYEANELLATIDQLLQPVGQPL